MGCDSGPYLHLAAPCKSPTAPGELARGLHVFVKPASPISCCCCPNIILPPGIIAHSSGGASIATAPIRPLVAVRTDAHYHTDPDTDNGLGTALGGLGGFVALDQLDSGDNAKPRSKSPAKGFGKVRACT